MNHHCSIAMKCTNLAPPRKKNQIMLSKADVTATTERKRLELIEARDRLTTLSSDYDQHITEIKEKLKEYQQIVESIDLMIRIVKLEKDQLKQKLKEQEGESSQAGMLLEGSSEVDETVLPPRPCHVM